MQGGGMPFMQGGGMPFMQGGGMPFMQGGGMPFYMPLTFPTIFTISSQKQKFQRNFFGERGGSKNFFLSFGRWTRLYFCVYTFQTDLMLCFPFVVMKFWAINK